MDLNTYNPTPATLAPRLICKEQMLNVLPRGLSKMKAQPPESSVKGSLRTTSLFRSVSCPAILLDSKEKSGTNKASSHSLPRTQSEVFSSQSDIHEYSISEPHVTMAPNFQSYYYPAAPDTSELIQHLCSVGAASCPTPPSCPSCCGCGCLPPPCNTPPKCIQYMTGYYYYPYGFWFCGPYHVTGTMCPGGPVCPGGPCGPCPPAPGGPCGPCNPGCVCAVLDPLFMGKPDESSAELKVDSTRITDVFSKLCCLPLTAPSTKPEKPSGIDSVRTVCGPCCGSCCSPCKASCSVPCGYGPCGPCGPCGPFGPCGTGFPGLACGKCGPCGPCYGRYCGPCGPCGACGPCGPCGPCGACGPCGPCGPCGACGPCGPCGPCGACGPYCGPCGYGCGPCGPCCGYSCYPPCVPMCRPWCGPCVNCAVPPLSLPNPPSMSPSMSGIISSFGPPPINSCVPMMPMPNTATMLANPNYIPMYPNNAYSEVGQRKSTKDSPQKRYVQSHPVSPRLIRKFPFSTTKDSPPEKLQSRTLPLVNNTLPAYFSTSSDLASVTSTKSDEMQDSWVESHRITYCCSCIKHDQKLTRCLFITSPSSRLLKSLFNGIKTSTKTENKNLKSVSPMTGIAA